MAVNEVGDEKYILSATMHADERNKGVSEQLGRDMYHYHLHVTYIPVVQKKIKAAAELVEKPQKLFMTDIVKKRQEGLPLTSEETAAYGEWRAKKSEYQREWRENNEGYFREYSRKRYHKKKAENVAVGL